MQIDDQSSLWALFAWHFGDDTWATAAEILDDALAVARFHDLLPPEIVASVLDPLASVIAS